MTVDPVQLEARLTGLEHEQANTTTQVTGIHNLLKDWKSEYDDDRKKNQAELTTIRERVEIMWEGRKWLLGVLASVLVMALGGIGTLVWKAVAGG